MTKSNDALLNDSEPRLWSSTGLAWLFGLGFVSILGISSAIKTMTIEKASWWWLLIDVAAIVLAALLAVLIWKRRKVKSGAPAFDLAGSLTLVGLFLCAVPSLTDLLVFLLGAGVPDGWKDLHPIKWLAVTTVVLPGLLGLAGIVAGAIPFKIGIDVSRSRDAIEAARIERHAALTHSRIANPLVALTRRRCQPTSLLTPWYGSESRLPVPVSHTSHRPLNHGEITRIILPPSFFALTG